MSRPNRIEWVRTETGAVRSADQSEAGQQVLAHAARSLREQMEAIGDVDDGWIDAQLVSRSRE
jgi:hypothetical protein